MRTTIYKMRWRILPIIIGPTMLLLRLLPMTFKVQKVHGGYRIRRWHFYAIWIEAAHEARSDAALAWRRDRQGLPLAD